MKINLFFKITITCFLALFLLGAASSNELFKKGIIAEASQNFQEAVTHFTESLKAEGESPDTYSHLGYNNSKISKTYANNAYKHYKRALKLDPNHEETLGLLGHLYLWKGNIIKANSILTQLKRLESGEAEELEKKLKRIADQSNKIK